MQELRETKDGRKVIIDRGVLTKPGTPMGKHVQAMFLDVPNAGFQPLAASKLKPKKSIKVDLGEL